MTLLRNILKKHFSGEGVLLNSIMDIPCRTTEGGADQNRIGCRCEGKGGQNFSLCEGHK